MADSLAQKHWTPRRDIIRKMRVLWWTGGVIITVALVTGILWKVPQLQVNYADIPANDRFNSENEARKTLATILGAIVLLGGAYFTWRNIKLVQEGQITDRFTKAIEQLGAVDAGGKKRLEVRLGGVYALERIANQSERDHWPIVEVLSAYVRENAPRKPAESIRQHQYPSLVPHPTVDIQAIFTVLSRRDRKYERTSQVVDLSRTDFTKGQLRGGKLWDANLRGADLTLADLREADLGGGFLSMAELRGANLSNANLSMADLRQTNLRGVDFTGADLSGAILSEADLCGADLSGADVRWAFLSGTDLSGAILGNANLKGAYLSGEDVSGPNPDRGGAYCRQKGLPAKGLTQAQIDSAMGDGTTELPDGLQIPERWKT